MSKLVKRAATRAATGRAFHFGIVYWSQQGSAATNTRLNTSGVPSENRGVQCRRHCDEGMKKLCQLQCKVNYSANWFKGRQ